MNMFANVGGMVWLANHIYTWFSDQERYMDVFWTNLKYIWDKNIFLKKYLGIISEVKQAS